MKNLFYLSIFIIACSCQDNSKKNTSAEIATPILGEHHSETIKKVLEAHGGFDVWSEKRELTFERGEEQHLIELRNRRVRVASNDWTIGYDGQDVWISPEENSYRGDARFFHNLYFYFFSMPFVLGDPGVYYEDLDDKDLMGTTYGAIKMSYGEGVGDSPKDNYILYYDKETHEMACLMYTVTFRTQEASERFSLIKYEGWNEVDGVRLPSKLIWYEYKDDVIGNPRREVAFDNIAISAELPDESLFQMPEDAKIVAMADN